MLIAITFHLLLLLIVVVLLMSQILVHHLLHEDLPIAIDLHHLGLHAVWLECELVLLVLHLLHPVLPIATPLGHSVAEALPGVHEGVVARLIHLRKLITLNYLLLFGLNLIILVLLALRVFVGVAGAAFTFWTLFF